MARLTWDARAFRIALAAEDLSFKQFYRELLHRFESDKDVKLPRETMAYSRLFRGEGHEILSNPQVVKWITDRLHVKQRDLFREVRT